MDPLQKDAMRILLNVIQTVLVLAIGILAFTFGMCIYIIKAVLATVNAAFDVWTNN